MSEREELEARFQEVYPDCCGEVDKGGTCCAPACTRGDVLKALSRLPKGNGELVEAVRSYIASLDEQQRIDDDPRSFSEGSRAKARWKLKDSENALRKALSDSEATPKPDPSPVCVAARELEWQEHPQSEPDEPDAWIAETSFGEYEIIHWLDGTYRCIRANRPVGKALPTLEAAQAACQADFTRRTLELVNARSVESVRAEARAQGAAEERERLINDAEAQGRAKPLGQAEVNAIHAAQWLRSNTGEG